MPQVMPSQIVEAIDNTVGNSMPDDSVSAFSRDHAPLLASLADLFDEVPPELLAACSASDDADLLQARSIIRQMCLQWQNLTGNQFAPVIRGKDVAKVLRRVMVALPDENPPAEHAGLEFITDPELRDSIRRDVGSAHKALGNAEWKPATVMAGASIEALLHWRLELFDQHVREQAKRAPAVRGKKKDLNDYVLYEYIEVSEDLQILNPTIVTMATLARGFRNLIHPGKARRTQERCTRSTALAAVAALEAVIETFEQNTRER
jgi:hypothetical protein